METNQQIRKPNILEILPANNERTFISRYPAGISKREEQEEKVPTVDTEI